MSQVTVSPDLIASAASDVSAIGSTLSAAHLAAAAPTLSLQPAAADEVSASIAHLFSGFGQDYQKLAGQADAFHEQFVQRLAASADAYARAEAANASLLQPFKASEGPTGEAASVWVTLSNLGAGFFANPVGFVLSIPFGLAFLALIIFAPDFVRGWLTLANGRTI